MSKRNRRQKIHMIKAGHYIAWERGTRDTNCVVLLDENGQMQKIWNRERAPGKRDNKKYFDIMQSWNGFFSLASTLADIFDLSIEKVDLSEGLSYEAAFRFVPLRQAE